MPMFLPIDFLGVVVAINIEAHFDISEFQKLRISEFNCQVQTLQRMKGFNYCQICNIVQNPLSLEADWALVLLSLQIKGKRTSTEFPTIQILLAKNRHLEN